MAITDDPELMNLLTKIHDEKGLDFTQYKEATLLRRINTRLTRRGVSSYADYAGILDREPEEYRELFDALTINVTEFFRNTEAFEAIERKVIPAVICSKRSQRHRIIRAWSCGCSSGDEPYSMAMLFLEKLGDARKDFLITIIGSDIDKGALAEAKDMVYSGERLKAVEKDMLAKYFDKAAGESFKLKNRVASMVRFRHHDIVRDKPFLHCDIILCRNLLIYFNKQLQEEVLLKFYECLNPGGYLVLGMVESLAGSSAGMFENVDNRMRIYRRPQSHPDKSGRSAVLSQEDIDRIVDDMLGKE